jgi:uncharacterized protein (TIGR00255 family)
MLASMTGFGRALVDAPFGRLVVEIQSVNRKYLEIFVSLPKEFGRFEHEVRKWIGELVSRGQISVRIYLIPSADTIEGLLPDPEVLLRLKYGWEKISQGLGYDPRSIDLSFLVQQMPLQSKVEMAKDTDLPILHRVVDEALQHLLIMKKTEGKALMEDLGSRIKELDRMVGEVEQIAPDATLKMRKKLSEKMEEFIKQGEEGEDRLMREIAFFAEKVDVSEEMTRLRSHFAQFKEFLSPQAAIIGRKMDFLVQEMGREINTIGSKSMDSKISHLVVEMKSELEKMREQIQNIE